jgi:hypothetical protein
MKYTPRPWTPQQTPNGIDIEEGVETIATVWDCENARANANLIAAAPEMLEALEKYKELVALKDTHNVCATEVLSRWAEFDGLATRIILQVKGELV